MPRIPDDIMGGGPRSSLRVVPVEPQSSGLREFGDSLRRVGQHLMEREDRFNYARAQSEFLKRQDELMAGIVDDDYQTYESRYSEGIKGALAQTQDMILSQSDRRLFEVDMSRQAQHGLQRIRDRAKGKEIDFGRSALAETLEANHNLALRAGDAATRNAYLRAGADAIEGARERGYLDAEQATKTRQKWAQDVAVGSLNAMEPQERLAQLDSVQFLPEDVRANIRRGAEREIKALQREAEAEAERARVKLRKTLVARVEDSTAAYLQGLPVDNPPTEGDFLDAYGEEGSERYASFQRLQDLGGDIAAVAIATPEERAVLLSEREPQVGEGFAETSRNFDTLLKAATALEKAKQNDPVAYINQHFGQIEDRDALLAEQERLGVEFPRLLTESQAKALASDFFRSSEDDGMLAAAQIEALEQEYGEHWPVVFSQLAESGLPGEALVIGSGVSSDVAETLSRISTVKTDDLKAGLPRTSGTDVNDTLSDIMQPFQKSMALQGGQRTFSTFYNQAERLAYHYMGQGLNHEKAATRAYEELVGEKYVFEDTYRIPLVSESGRPYDASRIADGAEKAKEALTPEMIGGALGGVSEEFLAERRQDILSNSYWVTNGNETGLILHYRGEQVGDVQVSFDDLEEQGSGLMERLSRLAERLSPSRVLAPLPHALLQQ